MDSTTLSPHRLVDLDLSDFDEHQVKGCDSSKENRKVEIFDVSSHLEAPSNCESGFSVLEITCSVEQSPVKIVPNEKPRKKKLMTKQNIPNILVDVISPQFKSNFKKNTSTENNSFIKPDKDYELKGVKSSSKPQKKGKYVASRYMQSAQNFRTRTPTKKESKSGNNMTLTEANCESSEELSVLSGNSNTNCNNQSRKNSSEESTYCFTRLKRNKKVGETESKQTSTPNKDDLPLPYSDASTIIQDVSTWSEGPKPNCRRDIFKTAKNKEASLPLEEPEVNKEQKAPLNQTEVDILYNNYIQTLYLDKMVQKAIQKREADAAKQIQDFCYLTQSDNEKELDLHLQLRKMNHNKLVTRLGELQRSAVSKVNNSLSDMKSKHHNLAEVLDTVPHQIATEGIFHSNDESYIDDLTNNFVETEQLLEKINDVTESKMPSLSLYNSHLKHLVETISTEKSEIVQINELLAAIESLTIQQSSLKFQHLEEEVEVKSGLILDI
ncbi:uncharacterized protein LOC106880657 [Octopus bimaculoides]|uniref:Uncharacterized protein n=1 Tax=Octopus bimaculoides TaxID=37653 RepID=A0A0L8FWS4_OCTBM|nr:uncharacterized protein LOC106880657 [Octopus bimaculoides]|eukprot:XP_014786188.1 PREDICTED: uncharacterized protein LOC106880657 [Octopus bimaculoides]